MPPELDPWHVLRSSQPTMWVCPTTAQLRRDHSLGGSTGMHCVASMIPGTYYAFSKLVAGGESCIVSTITPLNNTGVHGHNVAGDFVVPNCE